MVMIKAKDLVLWVDDADKRVVAIEHAERSKPHGVGWSDPIGARYAEWRSMSTAQRVQLMLETVIDLATNGFDLKVILGELSKVDEFKALGRQSYPMCRALTWALVGKRLEPNTMDFDDLLATYGGTNGKNETTDRR